MTRLVQVISIIQTIIWYRALYSSIGLVVGIKLQSCEYNFWKLGLNAGSDFQHSAIMSLTCLLESAWFELSWAAWARSMDLLFGKILDGWLCAINMAFRMILDAMRSWFWLQNKEYGFIWHSVNISQMVTPNDHMSDFVE